MLSGPVIHFDRSPAVRAESSETSSLRAIALWAACGTLAAALLSLLGLAGSSSWLADLFSHFRPQYAAALAVTLALHVWQRQLWLGGLAAGLLAANLASIAPVYAVPPASSGAEAEELTILQFNVLQHNERRREAVAYLEACGADLVLLQEIDHAWAEELARGLAAYEPVLVEARSTNFGIGLYLRRRSGIEVERARLVRIDDEGWRHPAIEAELRHGDRELALLGVHAHPPINATVARIHGIEIERIAQWSRARDGAHLVLGDLNMTPWSSRYRQLMGSSPLRSARDGFGIVASWRPLSGLSGGLPLDHILHDAAFSTTAFERGPSLGSDHQPILARLRWNATQAGSEGLARR